MKSMFLGIGRRIFISFLFLLFVVIVIISLVAIHFSGKLEYENASNELRVLSVVLTQQMTRQFRRIESDLRLLGTKGGVIDNEMSKTSPNLKSLQDYLVSRLPHLPAFESLAVCDAQGFCHSATEPDWKTAPVDKEHYFIAGKQKFNLDEIYEIVDQEKVLIASIPIGNDGNKKGILAAHVRLKSFYDLMNQKISLNESTEAFLLDKEFRFITPAKTAPDALAKSHLVSTTLMQHLKDEFWVGRYQNFKGEEVLGTVARLPNFNWYLVVETEVSEVESRLIDLKRSIINTALFLFLAILFTSILLTRTITRPLQTLVAEANRIGEGDLSRSVAKVGYHDEVSALSNELEKMRASLSQAQNRLLERLGESERLAAIGAIAASLAHEIRNPLNAISLLMSRFERTSDEQVKRETLIKQMRDEISRVDGLITEMLNYSRPLVLNRVKLNLSEILNSVLEIYNESFLKQKIEVKMNLSPVMLSADSDRLKQAIINIIQNSIEAMPSGGILNVSTGLKDQLGFIQIEDSGVGITDEQRSRIFDLFYTTKEKGTGLGLSNVRKIVDAHAGQINISSTYGRGTKVVIQLPII